MNRPAGGLFGGTAGTRDASAGCLVAESTLFEGMGGSKRDGRGRKIVPSVTHVTHKSLIWQSSSSHAFHEGPYTKSRHKGHMRHREGL